MKLHDQFVLWRLASSQFLSFVTCLFNSQSRGQAHQSMSQHHVCSVLPGGHIQKKTHQQPRSLWLPSGNAKVKPIFPKQLDTGTVEQCRTYASPMVFHRRITLSIQCWTRLQSLCWPLGRSKAEQRRDDLLSATAEVERVEPVEPVEPVERVEVGRVEQWLLDVGSVSMTEKNK